MNKIQKQIASKIKLVVHKILQNETLIRLRSKLEERPLNFVEPPQSVVSDPRAFTKLPLQIVREVLNEFKIDNDMMFAFSNRGRRWEVWEPCQWLLDHVDNNAKLLETGCSLGSNLIWLGERGWNNLGGLDIDAKGLSVAKVLAEHAGLKIDYTYHDCTKPFAENLGKWKVILGLAWIFLVDDFTYGDFLQAWSPQLEDGGFLLFDTIDASYNQVPGNQYFTQDWDKPKRMRRPSEYRIRLSYQDVDELIKPYGLEIVKVISEEQTVSRCVYICTKKPILT